MKSSAVYAFEFGDDDHLGGIKRLGDQYHPLGYLTISKVNLR